MKEITARAKSSPGTMLRIAIWYGITTGLAEGAGLLLFQRVNWARWGPTMHVSWPILWISPVVDLLFFMFLALLIHAVTRLFPRIPAISVLIFLLTFLAIYDGLTLTNRLYHHACQVLALGAAAAFLRWFRKRENSIWRFWRRTAPWACAVFVLALAGIQGGSWLGERNAVGKLPVAAAGSPNVLILVVDTLRADHLSSYGYARATSPNFDRMASEGVLFENAIAPCSWSLPSHVSLVTGRYLFEHGVGNVQAEPWRGWGTRGLGGYPTLGEALEQKGYRTGAFSANRTYFSHDLGFGRGFQHFEDYFHSAADMFVRTLYGREFSRIYLIRSDQSLVKRMLRGIGFTSLLDQDAEGSGSYGGAFGIRKHADVVNEEALGWIDRDRQRPFFAFLNYFDVHDPYGGPHSYPKPSWEQEDDNGRYDDGVKYADDFMGQLMQELQKRGLDKHTIVILTSDHGESLGQHGLQTHGGSLYWELIHVPLVLWYPGHAPAGVRISTPVSNAAIPATVLDFLGDGGNPIFPGPALNALWKYPGSKDHWPGALSELAQNKYGARRNQAPDPAVPTAKTGAMRSLVEAPWQLIRHQTLEDQIYDWVIDPGELHNLIETPEGKAAAAALRSEMAKRMNDSPGR